MKRLPLNSPHFLFLLKDLARWLDVLGYATKTVQCFPVYLREFFHWLEARGITQIQQITTALIQQYYLHLSQRANNMRKNGNALSLSKGSGALSTGYLNKHLNALNKLADYLQRNADYLLPHHQLALEKPSYQPITPLTIAQVKQLYQATEHYEKDWPLHALRDRAMLALLYDCGLRRMEAIHVCREDLHLQDRTLLVRKGKNSKQRIVPFSQPTAIHLIDYCYLARPQLLKNKATKTLLVNRLGNPCCEELPSVRLKTIQRHTTDTELKHRTLHPHLLRHSIATHLLHGGMSLEHVSRFLGHSSLDITQRYTHLVQEYAKLI